MIFDWFGKAKRREQAQEQALRLGEIGRGLPLLHGLTDDEWQRLAGLAVGFLHDKSLLPINGMLVEQEAALVALQAVLPVLNLGEEALAGWQEVILYPDAFVTRDLWFDYAGLAHEGEQVLIGQARQDGPLVLSLPAVADSPELDGWNVVIHEIAHKLDMLNGAPNGYPPLHKGMSREQWASDWGRAYDTFCRDLDTSPDGESEQWPWLDPYAGEHPAEFFAVLSEAFFETPHWLQCDLPELYRHLAAFYRQDPVKRLPEPGESLGPSATGEGAG
ncbi:zinc-dependent peptidase [Crenobacter sp. SG2303]|uniref:Zinc-dependent peptidase n=1 Tax=Crenobacter oryzisoli TaxID=3056844 RepID=A0ABT7XSX7_9NEIS|nr:M90 family metallopeptidase [Crenobacter sp. SG2303]MDN0076888.1 zinc-dependent peptidase [Crenobacter sp. SG2303]